MAIEKVGFTLAYTTDGGPPSIKNVPVISTAYYQGQVLRVSATTGSAGLAAAAGTTIYGVMASNVTAAQAASSTAGDGHGRFPMYTADDRNIFQAVMIATGARQKRVTDTCDIRLATGNYRLQGTSSTKVCSIVGYDPNDASTATSSGAKYYIRFARQVLAQTKAGQG